jgi:predicted DNA-binding transcriptional regulator YafY
MHQIDARLRANYYDYNPQRLYPSYGKLAEMLDVSWDTARRDLTRMRDRFHLPIEYFTERRGWGYTKIPPRLSGLYMEEGELLVLAASWGALEGRRGSDIGPKVRTCMEKLMNVLGHDLSFDFKTVSERIAFRSSGYHSAIDVAVFETVTSAVLSQHELGFTYRKQELNPDGTMPEPETRLVQPRCMVCVDNAWYIFADDPACDSVERAFALFRMSDAIDTSRKFQPGHPFDLESVLRDSIGIHRSGPVETVELLFDAEVAGYVQEHLWHATEQFGIADDGRLLLTMKVAVNPELEAKIHRWEPNVEVINPPELREVFARAARKTFARYSG